MIDAYIFFILLQMGESRVPFTCDGSKEHYFGMMLFIYFVI